MFRDAVPQGKPIAAQEMCSVDEDRPQGPHLDWMKL
jgi:hypothetical protein